jgi:hypothetical protein
MQKIISTIEEKLTPCLSHVYDTNCTLSVESVSPKRKVGREAAYNLKMEKKNEKMQIKW